MLKLFFLPAVHFLVSVLLVGIGLLALLQNKKPTDKVPHAGNFLFAVSLGILYNALQFGLVLLVQRQLPFLVRSVLGISKYVMDLVFLLFIFLFFRNKYLSQLKRITPVFLVPGNAALLLLSLLLGFVAVINFPHVHDSVQLMLTNMMSFPFKRLVALGFSALCYFPTTVAGGVPMASMAAGFKLFLLLLSGMTAIYGMEKLETTHRTANQFVYFFIIVLSIFGLRGVIEVGKDSAWAVLFSLIFIFSLFNRKSGLRPLESISYFLCAASLGLIAVPYLFIFLATYLLLRTLPTRLTGHRMFLPAAVVLLLVVGFMIMPVKLAINTPPGLESVLGPYSYWHPTDGQVSFINYFFFFKFNGYANSPWVMILGLVGIFLLPWIRKGIQDLAMQTAALFLLVASSACLLLALLGRNFFPSSLDDKIPLTPFSTFDAWDLIKDIPQWCVQIIFGIFCILLLEALASRIAAWRRPSGIAHGAITIFAIAAIASSNLGRIVDLASPAYFFSYGGNKNKHMALSFEILHNLPTIKTILLTNKVKALNPLHFFFDAQSYFPGKKIKIDWKVDAEEFISLAGKKPVLLIADTASYLKLQDAPNRLDGWDMIELAYFKESDEGIYFMSRKQRTARAPRLPRKKNWLIRSARLRPSCSSSPLNKQKGADDAGKRHVH